MTRLTRRRNKAATADLWAQLIRKGDCLEWPGAAEKNGYVLIHWHGKKWRGHRLAYLLAHPDWDQQGWICHSCDNKACCNPAHLWVGNGKTNAADMHTKHRGYLARGEGNGHAKLTNVAVADIRASPLKQEELAAKHNVSRSLISMIRSGKRWGHL